MPLGGARQVQGPGKPADRAAPAMGEQGWKQPSCPQAGGRTVQSCPLVFFSLQSQSPEDLACAKSSPFLLALSRGELTAHTSSGQILGLEPAGASVSSGRGQPAGRPP